MDILISAEISSERRLLIPLGAHLPTLHFYCVYTCKGLRFPNGHDRAHSQCEGS